MQCLVGGVGEEGILLYLLSQRGTVQKIGVKQKSDGVGHGAILNSADSHYLAGGDANHCLLVEIVFSLSVVYYAPFCLFQKKSVNPHHHSV